MRRSEQVRMHPYTHARTRQGKGSGGESMHGHACGMCMRPCKRAWVRASERASVPCAVVSVCVGEAHECDRHDVVAKHHEVVPGHQQTSKQGGGGERKKKEKKKA